MDNCNNQRWGECTNKEIEKLILNSIPLNTERNKKSIWKQFMDFCATRQYTIERDTSIDMLASYLKDYACNMRKSNGENYKETVIKTIWNTLAKMLQEKYYTEFKIKFDPFRDIEFKQARCARDSKRKQLQSEPNKRKLSAVAFTSNESTCMQTFWDEDNPYGLQKKFFNIVATELAWRGNEAAFALTHYFKRITDHYGNDTGRIEYNPIFTKTTQGGASRCANSKWLTQNVNNINVCPVRLFNKLMNKRPNHVTSERLFLTPNPFWKNSTERWYKNLPVGVNELSKWTKQTAQAIGIDVQNNKITNHSHRSTAVTIMANAGISDQQLIKITGHSSANSIQPYLNMQPEQHNNILEKMRGSSAEPSKAVNPIVSSKLNNKNEGQFRFKNCTFNNCQF